MEFNGRKLTAFMNTAPATINDEVIGSNLLMSSKATVDRLTPAFAESGAVVTCEPVEGYPLNVTSHIVPKQSGSGTPSPDNVRPITGYDTVKLSRTGRNLFGGDALADAITAKGGIKDEKAKTVSFGAGLGGTYTNLFTKFKPNTQYTFIIRGKASAEAQNLCVWYTEEIYSGMKYERLSNFPSGNVDGDLIYTSRAGKTISAFGTIYHTAATTTLDYNQCGVFEGVITKEDFEHYKGNTFTAELGQTVYGGTYNWRTGELTISYVSIVFDGITAGKKVALTDSGAKTYAYLTPIPNGSIETVNPKQGGKIYSDRAACSIPNGSVVLVSMSKAITGVTDSDTATQVVSKINAVLKNWYDAGTPLTCVYELSAPKTVQLTPQEILALSATNNLFSSTGDTDVNGRADTTTVIERLTNAIIALGGNI